MPTALTHLRTVQRNVTKGYQIIKDGEFRFRELLKHLKEHKCAKIVKIGEDATRLISRVDYDNSSDELVGFVLPSDGFGLPKLNSFVASSFESIEKHYSEGKIAKYAFVYMAQPLSKSVPGFILACLSSDNQFTAEQVMQRWKYIHSECSKLGINVVSFGADGDSRETKGMRVSCQLQYKPESLQLSPSFSLPKMKFALKHPTSICYVQDTVHIAVKMKSRLLKPSIILPLGKHTAGMHSLSTVRSIFHKGEHGLREKDLNQKDKQNYEAVMRITSSSALAMLKEIPDALGTYYYLDVLRSVIDSYLDKQLSPLVRVEKIWYAVFFLRYWRDYLHLNKNNFLSQNAYICVELNAHALIILLIILRDGNQFTAFMPWLLGSQACEKAFRAARSMTSTFSTVINFSMLGLLTRLHRMEIQLKLEAEDENEIVYPRVKQHRKKKKGHQKQFEYDLSKISDEQIHEAVKTGRIRAKAAMEALGMEEDLKKAAKPESLGKKNELKKVVICFENPSKTKAKTK